MNVLELLMCTTYKGSRIINAFQMVQDAMLHKGFSVVATGDMMSSSAFLGHTPSIQHLVKPFSATAQITRNCSLEPLKISNGPRVNVNVIVEEVPIVLSENQFIQFVKLSDLFQMRWKSQKYRELRPRVPVLNGSVNQYHGVPR